MCQCPSEEKRTPGLERNRNERGYVNGESRNRKLEIVAGHKIRIWFIAEFHMAVYWKPKWSFVSCFKNFGLRFCSKFTAVQSFTFQCWWQLTAFLTSLLLELNYFSVSKGCKLTIPVLVCVNWNAPLKLACSTCFTLQFLPSYGITRFVKLALTPQIQVWRGE